MGSHGAPCTVLLPLDLNRSMKKTKNIFDKLPIYLMDVFPRRIPSYSLGRLENEFCYFSLYPSLPLLLFLSPSLPYFSLSLPSFPPFPHTHQVYSCLLLTPVFILPSPYFSYLLPHWGPPLSSRLPQPPQDHHHDCHHQVQPRAGQRKHFAENFETPRSG